MPRRKQSAKTRSAITRSDNVKLDLEIEQILGPPPLSKGEREEDYRLLYQRLRATLKPQDILEELWVRDVLDLSWETLRLRWLKAKLMEAASADGLDKTLAHIARDWMERNRIVGRWAANTDNSRRQVRRILKEAKLGHGIIQAQTLSARLDDFVRIDRLIMLSESRRNAILREIDRYRDVIGRRKREALTDIQDAEFEDASDREGRR